MIGPYAGAVALQGELYFCQLNDTQVDFISVLFIRLCTMLSSFKRHQSDTAILLVYFLVLWLCI